MFGGEKVETIMLLTISIYGSIKKPEEKNTLAELSSAHRRLQAIFHNKHLTNRD